MKAINNNFSLNSNTFSNRKTNQGIQSRSLNKLLNLGESMISDKKFDIKQYLDTAENQFKKIQRKNRKLKGITNYSTDHLNFKKGKSKILSTYTNNNFFNNNRIIAYPKNSNEILNDYKNDISIKRNLENKKIDLNFNSLSTDKFKKNYKIKYLNTFSNNNYNKSLNEKNKYNKNSRYNNMFDDNKKSIKIINKDEGKNSNKKEYNYQYDNDEEDSKLCKIEKVVYQIKKNLNKNFNIKKYLEKVKNIYDKKNILYAIDSDLVLKNYKEKKKYSKEEDIPISTFITQNKEITIKNLLMKVINKESNKIIKKKQKLDKDLKIDINNVETEEQKLEEYSDLHRLECQKIGIILKTLQKKNKDLMAEEKKIKLEVKEKEYEIYKILIQMNLYRFYAKFANQVLDGDATRFEKPILSEMAEFDKIDFEPIIKEVIDNYSSMKKFDYKKEKKDRKSLKFYKEEGYFLYDPELISYKYNEMEGNILRLLKSKEKLIIKIKKRQKQNNEALAYLIDRCKILQQEYDEIKKDYNNENKKFSNYAKNNGSTHIDVNIHEKNNLIQDLYMNVINVFEPSMAKLNLINDREFNLVDRKDLLYFEDIVEYGQKILENIEINLNFLLIKMKNDEKKDKETFNKVIYGIKTDYKLLRQSKFFKNQKEMEKNKINKILEKSKKIILISKKFDLPYYKNKENKKEEIDYNLIKKEEDKELMTYH